MVVPQRPYFRSLILELFPRLFPFCFGIVNFSVQVLSGFLHGLVQNLSTVLRALLLLHIGHIRVSS